MIPLMVRSALTTGALPETPGSSGQCSWIDVDTLAKTILDIGDVGQLGGKTESSRLVYNLVHPRPFSWKEDFLPALKNTGLDFEVTSWRGWLEKLKNSERDVKKNHSRKLLGFWEEGSRRDGTRVVTFETTAAEAKSEAMKAAESIVDGDYVAGLVAAWKAVW
jgi:hypothetical protein